VSVRSWCWPRSQRTPEELREHCKGLIAGYKSPRSAEFVDALPMGGAGKVLKRSACPLGGIDRSVG
jgi:acyl-CoA synthetase (AMP-forming)/AMP-acid ligase II